jgi:hypothetical protein
MSRPPPRGFSSGIATKILSTFESLETFTAVFIHIVFRYVTPCSHVGVYQLVEEHAASVFRWNQHVPTKRRYASTRLHGVTTKKTSVSIYIYIFLTSSYSLPSHLPLFDGAKDI